MKKAALKIALSIVTVIIAILVFVSWSDKKNGKRDSYRGLNKNGKMDVYEDPKQLVEARINDLLKQMSIEEKAGMMFINGARVNDDGSIEDKPGTGTFSFAPNALKLVNEKKMNHFNLWAISSVDALARWYNSMQKYMEDSTRLGIPM